MKDLRTIILAAGKGTRMKSETPKVLHKISGRPLIDYVLEVAKAVGSLKICVVLGHQAEQVREHLGPAVSTVIQKKLLGTADAVKCAKEFCREYRGDVLILCGDTPLLRKESIRDLLQRHRRQKAACTFLTAVVEDSQGYGRVIRDGEKKVLAIREEGDATFDEKKIREINVGVYCFQSELLFKAVQEIGLNPTKKEFYLTDIIALFVQQGLMIETTQTDTPQEGLGVNTREGLAIVGSFMRENVLKNLMEQGVTIIDPLTTFIDHTVKIGTDTIIKPFTVIEENVKIGKKCLIGPFAHLRPETRIADGVEIGNFAEVSRSSVGEGSIMKHFSFLGDATVGKKVNIGAGVVTANFDGEKKHRTSIGDEAFIGSDSILVAPT
ncbi:MAG: NTP transferase domain-containing protein, partial [Candidatus Omnitrophica bacterium]|nr:NTP transferase domain-containing protein [Candidatus Omnitrophota bacterium]